MQNTEQKLEIRSFTAQDLDVQKLEERLEMASASPWGGCDTDAAYQNAIANLIANCNALK